MAASLRNVPIWAGETWNIYLTLNSQGQTVHARRTSLRQVSTDSDPSGSRVTSYLNINMIEQEGFEIYNQITTLELWACYANVMTSVVRVYFQSWKLAF